LTEQTIEPSNGTICPGTHPNSVVLHWDETWSCREPAPHA
jgi:hypothetical protein